MPRLLIEVLPPHAKAGAVTFDKFPVTIGRNPKCGLVFDAELDRATSWNHADIAFGSDGFLLTDKQSTNGTFVNGKKVSTVILKDGDRIELGHGGPQIRVHLEADRQVGISTAKTMVATSDLPTIHLKLIDGARGRPPIDRDFHQETITLGRDPQSDIEFGDPPHPVVSRHHAEIVLRGGEYHLVDKKATNGTLLNGRRIEHAALSNGDKITLGEGGPVFEVGLKGVVSETATPLWRRLAPLAAGLVAVVVLAAWLWPRPEENTNTTPQVLSEQQFIEREVIHFAKLMNNDIESVPTSLVKNIQRYSARLARQDHNAFLAKLQHTQELLPVVQRILRENDLPEALAYIALQESGFDPKAKSGVGAAGLWQFMIPTAREYGLEVRGLTDERLDPVKSTYAACKYIKWLYSRFGDFMLVMAAYNHGPGNVSRALTKIEDPIRNRNYWYLVKKDLLPRETDEYVYKIISGWIVATNPVRYGFPAELSVATPGGA